MKYLFINSVAGYGSTGRIVADTCRQLMAQGHECCIAYGRKENAAQDISSVSIGGTFNTLAHALESRLLDDSGFGSRLATRRFVSWIRDYDPDVIWLHNVHGYYVNLEILFTYLRTCKKKIYWTLHDCWAFTGHCAYFDYVGCEKWKTGCSSCPQKGEYPNSLFRDNSARNYLAKKRLFTGIPDVTLITPSHWLAGRVRQSFLGEYPVEVRYNTVNRTVFRPVESDYFAKLGLADKKILLGVANVWDRRKGLEDFVALSELLGEAYAIVLIGLSEKQIQALPKKIIGLPRTSNVQELVEAYSGADIYINPSTEETFGMTVLEAACCGTPAIVYEDTACEEIVKQYGGIAVPRGAEHLRDAIERQGKEY